MATSGQGGANCDPASPNRSDGATGPHGASSLKMPLRRHALHFVVETQRVGDPARLRVHAGEPRGDDPRAAARERVLLVCR